MTNAEVKKLLYTNPPPPANAARFNQPATFRPFRDLRISQNRQVAYLKGTDMKWKLK